MKGIIFTEFQEMVETKFGLEVYDKLVSSSNLESGAIYTSVGTYDCKELVQMVVQLSQETGIAIPDLIQAFGKHLFTRLAIAFPHFVDNASSSIELMSQIEDHIHVEVRKLYPDAELPNFEFQQLGDTEYELLYTSARPFADLAEGLIVGAIEHYEDPVEYQREDDPNSQPGTRAKFLLRVNQPVEQ